MKWIISTTIYMHTIISKLYLAHLGSNHPMALVFLGESIDGIVRCNESLLESAILESYWMTYNEATETVVIGACFYNCVNNAFKELSTILCQVLVSN